MWVSGSAACWCRGWVGVCASYMAGAAKKLHALQAGCCDGAFDEQLEYAGGLSHGMPTAGK